MPAARSSTCLPAVSYRVEISDAHAHLFAVTLTVRRPAAVQRFMLPVWIPGSYLVREFSRHLQDIDARQGRRRVPLRQLDKHRWEADADPGQPLTLRYRVYAFDPSVRTAWLDAARGFFNGTSLFLRAEGCASQPHALELAAPESMADWLAATGAAPEKVNKKGWGRYRASDYDELVDHPVEMGAFWSGTFQAGGVPHRFVVAGAPAGFDGARLLADARRICEAEIRFWHDSGKGPHAPHCVEPLPPHTRYLFLLNAVDEGYGGLEHRNSTALICNRRDLPRLGEAKASTGYTTLRGLISHEYFHTWNVKRLRPAEFAQFDYTRENHTELLWFFEGFTSYYDDLLLRRAGLLDDAGYLALLNKTINQVQQAPGRKQQSVAQASFDAWIKYYRPDENTPNATISYYAKGALVALCLDLTLRAEGHGTLDDVMRGLWMRSHTATPSGLLRESDVADALRQIGQRSYAKELAAWVHGTSELPLRELLTRHGVAVLDDPAQLAQRLGLRVAENGGVFIKTVLRGSAAERAGFAPNDEWLALELPDGSAWRLSRLDDLLLYAGHHKKFTALAARDKRLLRLPLTLPPPAATWRLAVQDAQRTAAWLAAPDG